MALSWPILLGSTCLPVTVGVVSRAGGEHASLLGPRHGQTGAGAWNTTRSGCPLAVLVLDPVFRQGLSSCVLTGIDYKTTTILLDGRRVKLELW